MKAREITESAADYQIWMAKVIELAKDVARRHNVDLDSKIKTFGIPDLSFEALYTDGFQPKEVADEVFTLLKNKKVRIQPVAQETEYDA